MCVFFMHVVPLMHVFQLVHLLYLNALKAIGVSVIQLVPDHVYDWCDVKRLQWSKWIATATFFHIHVVPPANSKHHLVYLISIQTRDIFCYSCDWEPSQNKNIWKNWKNWFFTKNWKYTHLEYFIRIYLQTIHHH